MTEYLSDEECLDITLSEIRRLFALTRSVHDVEEVFSWLITVTSGSVENVESGVTRSFSETRTNNDESLGLHT